MTTRAEIVAEARRWIGTPFKHQGRLRGIGVDCIGACVVPATTAGIQGLPDVANYSRQSHPDTALPLLRSCMDEVDPKDARDADVLVFFFANNREPQHYAIKTDVGILHAFEHVGRVVETAIPVGWVDKVHSAWRFRGIEAA